MMVKSFSHGAGSSMATTVAAMVSHPSRTLISFPNKSKITANGVIFHLDVYVDCPWILLSSPGSIRQK